MVKKKHVEEPHEDHADETWLIPYSDLLTLLLALFIVLFASSSLDKKKAAMISATFSQAFSSNSAGQLYGGLMDFLDDAGGLGLGEGISLGTDNRGVVIEISAISLFDEDDVKIKSQIIPDLEKIATLLNGPRYRRFQIMVEGHTDNRDFKSDIYPSNWELSSARAGAVVRELVSMGVESVRLRATGMAGVSPKYPNMDAYGETIPQNQKLNNRLEIKIEM